MPAGRLPIAYCPLIGHLPVQSAPMSSRDRSASRTEARRRARLAARGELPEEERDEAPEQPASRGGFLQRIFPPAPPLPNKPDPLRGYEGSGPLRPITERIYLLRRNLLAWLALGVIGFLGFFASFSYGNDLLGLVGTFVLFGSLIGAGWFGWQRPTLYGTAAALVAFVLGAAFLLYSFALLGAGPEELGPGTVISNLLIQAVYLAGLGFIGGWYGGYLRRRQTQLNAETRRRR